MANYFNSHIQRSQESFLFLLLVHEFGHCLYRREHDQEMISVPGFNIFFEKNKGLQDNQEIGGEIPVSVMATDTSSRLGNFFLTEGIKSCYLAEIAGLNRWENRQDLETVDGIKLIHP